MCQNEGGEKKMKFKVKIKSEEPIVLPIHYNHILKGFIFSNFFTESSPFTFSNLFGPKKVSLSNKKIIFNDHCHFYFSTIESSHLKLEELLNKLLNLGRNRVKVEEITPVEEEVNGQPVVVKTLSPITVFRRESGGKTFYFSPDREEFYRLLEENLNEKVKKFLGKEAGGVKIKPSQSSVFKKAVVQYRNRFIVEAWKGMFEIEGEREAIEAALKLGLGYKNSQGFGMVAISG